MSARLASFRGPSTPLSKQRHPSTPPPASPSRSSESTFHRKIRTLLQELRAVCQTWNTLVLIDGLKAAKHLVDARTDLDNSLASLPSGEHPRYRIVGPKLRVMDKDINDLEVVISKLKKQFQRMNTLVDNMESVLYEAHKAKGWQWVDQEPLWVTWSLRKFVSSVPALLIPYHRSLHTHTDLVKTLRPHSVSFESSREAIATWVAQPELEDAGWDAQWEDLCKVEIERWDSSS